MKKEEILEKSRKENKDEGTAYAESKGRVYGIVGLSIMFIIIIFYNLFMGLSSNSVFALFWGFMSLEAYGRYTMLKTKMSLVTAVCGGLASVLFLINYFLRG